MNIHFSKTSAFLLIITCIFNANSEIEAAVLASFTLADTSNEIHASSLISNKDGLNNSFAIFSGIGVITGPVHVDSLPLGPGNSAMTLDGNGFTWIYDSGSDLINDFNDGMHLDFSDTTSLAAYPDPATDWTIFVGQPGNTSSQAVPEPSIIMLSSLFGWSLLIRRRKIETNARDIPRSGEDVNLHANQ